MQYQYDKYKDNYANGHELSNKIEQELDVPYLLKRASKLWDGGYVLSGLIGSGDSFTMRDPWA